jgi:hypothetical protein
MSSVMDANYNLTKIFSNDVINNTDAFFVAFNNELGGVFFFGILVVIGIIMFVGLKYSGSSDSDSQALTFAGIITTFVGIVFVVLGLVTWAWMIPIVVITLIALFVNFQLK